MSVLRPVALPSEGFSICRAVADKFDDDRFKVSVVPVSIRGVDVQNAGSSSPPSDALPTASTRSRVRTRSWVASSCRMEGTSLLDGTLLGVWGICPTIDESDSDSSWDRRAAEMSIDKSVCDLLVVISGSTSRHHGSSNDVVRRGDLHGVGRCRGTTNEGSRLVPGARTFSRENRRQKGENQEKYDGASKKANCFPKVRPSARQRDQYGCDQWYQNNQDQGHHGDCPIKTAAALLAIPTLRRV